MLPRHLSAILVLSFASTTVSAAVAQQTNPGASVSPAGGNWQSVKALPVKTKVHITTDHGGRSCSIFSVTDEALTCAKGGNSAGAVIQRPEIRHIKLTHYVRSTLVGAGIGGGAGAIAGGIAGRTKPCPSGQTFCLNGIGIGAGGVAAIFGVGGAVLGSLIGGPTDMARGSSIYVRP